mgnify:CR=1 FL=1
MIYRVLGCGKCNHYFSTYALDRAKCRRCGKIISINKSVHFFEGEDPRRAAQVVREMEKRKT